MLLFYYDLHNQTRKSKIYLLCQNKGSCILIQFLWIHISALYSYAPVRAGVSNQVSLSSYGDSNQVSLSSYTLSPRVNSSTFILISACSAEGREG